LTVRQPRHAFGLIVAFCGVLIFTPDALLFRLTDAEPLTVAFWRGLLAGGVMLAGTVLFYRGRALSVLFGMGWIGLVVASLQAANLILFCAALWYTTAANTLVIIASAPMLAALMSRAFLGEHVSRGTWVAICAVMIGVLIVASGDAGDFGLLGEVFAFANALTIAGFFVAVRKSGEKDMLPSIGVGYLLGALLMALVADFPDLNSGQWGWLSLSGLVVLPGALICLTIAARHVPAPEVSMIVLLEVVLGPLLVWSVMGEDPGVRTLVGGSTIVLALFLHAWWRLKHSTRSSVPSQAA
jgi:drug/metabolite transporter (DMT)-like permease